MSTVKSCHPVMHKCQEFAVGSPMDICQDSARLRSFADAVCRDIRDIAGCLSRIEDSVDICPCERIIGEEEYDGYKMDRVGCRLR